MRAPWTSVFSDPKLCAEIARMDGAERLRTLDRLREAIAKCPSSLGLGSFWAHMQSCSDDEWDRTVARNAQVLSAVAFAAASARPSDALGIFPQACGLLSARLVPRCRSAASTPRR